MGILDWMDKKTKLQTLEQLALQVFFDELVYKATPGSTQMVRDLIDQQLMQAGTVKKSVRETFVAKLNEIFNYKFNEGWKGGVFTPEQEKQFNEDYKNYSNSDGEKDILHEYAPLDCVLDEHFDGELKIYTPTPTFDSIPMLMSIIDRWSPKLKDLTIWFHHCPYKLVNMVSTTTPSSSITVMPSLEKLRFECLTHLYLHELDNLDDEMQPQGDPLNNDRCHKSLLSFIGKHCPVLISLSAHFEFCIKKKHLLGLLLDGDVKENLFPADDERWSQDSVLEGLQVPMSLLNPLCSTLQQLHLDMNCYGRNCDCRSLPTLAVLAFTLRHLPKLRSLYVSPDDDINIELFKIIHKVKEMGMSPHQTEFEEACRDAAVAFKIVSGQEMIKSPTPFTDFPLMEQLNSPIPLRDADLFRAIGSLCPHLKKVTFKEELECLAYYESAEEEKLYAEKLVPLLSGWSSEINDVKLSGVKPIFVKRILEAIGSNLTTLRFESCKQIDFQLLASCSKLEKLSIDGYSTIKSEINDAAIHWTPGGCFLPSLTTFECSVCLGVWSPLMIEKKSTKLTRLSLECCHIGTQALNPRLEWDQIPELWPNMESWCIRQCTGLTMTTVSKLIPQFKKLRVIQLPHSVFSHNRKLTKKIRRELSNKKEPVKIIDLKTYSPSRVCPFQQP